MQKENTPEWVKGARIGMLLPPAVLVISTWHTAAPLQGQEANATSLQSPFAAMSNESSTETQAFPSLILPTPPLQDLRTISNRA